MAVGNTLVPLANITAVAPAGLGIVDISVTTAVDIAPPSGTATFEYVTATP